jgi:NADH-quinone oxidoreductase subunit L
MVFLTFHGDARSGTAEDPHGVRWNVKFPLVVLGVLAAVAGFVNMVPVQKVTGLQIDFLHQWLEHGYAGLTVEHYGTLLHDFANYGEAGLELSPLGPGAVSLGLALAGAIVAHRLYNVPEPVEHTDRLGGIKTVLYNNYYQDEYQVWIANGLTRPLARAANKFDGGVVDGVVNGVSSVSLFSGNRIRRIQTGVVSNYAVLLTLGLTALILAFGLIGGWFV